MDAKPPGHRRAVVVLVVAALLITAIGVYLQTAARGTTGSLSSEVSTLKSQVTDLEQANSNLQSLLASGADSDSNASSSSAGSLYAKYSASVVTIQGYEETTQNTFFGQLSSIESIQGSGFVLDYQNSSYVVTNNHVVAGASNITVTFSDGNSYPASVKGTDQYRDLAVLTVSAPASEFHPLNLLSSTNAVIVGETVFAIGSPFGLSGSVTGGLVSQVGRTITESTNTQITIPDVIQFSAAINPGNSGGPLLDSNGNVVGITTATASNSEGLGFAIPASTLSREFPSLVSNGDYTLHPDLGLGSTADMTYQLAQVTGSNVTYGVLVESVVSGGPADTAGIHGGTNTVTVEGQSYVVGGDIIISINGVRVVDSDALASYLEENTTAGQTVQLGIIRSGTYTSASVVLGAY
ncbi:MAG TPA: trypsin-like peptidase domain-containing protein [Nitrososphaerales archaeon]|nr:trypsin-like peptidase domain-containing protein [Nitrososphaerales archaeon]